MTDNEIAKIREKISCPQFGDDRYGEWGILTLNQRKTIYRLLEEINRQKAEIERLNNLKMFEKFIDERIHTDKVRGLSWEFKTKEDRNKAFEKELEKLFDIATAKAEAVKEFAERLKCGVSITSGIITCENIDNLVKEMIGE